VASDAPLFSRCAIFVDDRLRNISLTARAGEIVGLGGLDGQGQRELLLALFACSWRVGRGARRRHARACVRPARRKSKRIGMALIPEDRKTEG